MDAYSHTTSVDNLVKVLEAGGHIHPLTRLAKENPDLKISAETSVLPFLREELAAQEAVEKMRGIKEVDKVFLVRNGYLPNYGDATVVKNLASPKARLTLNTIPDEHTTGRSISLKHNAVIYVPGEKLRDLVGKYPHIDFRDRAHIDLRAIGWKDRLQAYPGKIMARLGLSKEAEIRPKDLASVAMLGGSTGLGLSTDKSDMDYLLPYKSQYHYNKAVERIKAKFPELQERAWTLKRPDKSSLTGKINGQEVDVILAVGEKPMKYKEQFLKVKETLTPEQKQAIIDRKKELKESWFLPGIRYRWYKNRLAEELGLKQLYF